MSHSLSSVGERPHSTTKIFGRERPLHELLGGGKVANIVLWRDKRLSAAILIGATVIWFLFEVVEYHFLTLLCHICITAMLVVFIWSNGAALLDGNPPKIPEVKLSKSTLSEVALAFHAILNQFMSFLHNKARGKDIKPFILAVASLWIVSVIGSYCSFLNLLYLGFLCIHTLPALYEQYEAEVDHLATKGLRNLKELYKNFDSKFLNKIPREAVKEKKFQ